MQSGLSFDQAPPISGPLRFFLSAPLFGLLAAATLLWQGPGALTTRWMPATLALTHLMTLGFMAMTMMGAMLQMLPVMAGSPVPWARFTAASSHALLTLGTLALWAGLACGSSLFTRLALPPLGLAFFGFLLAAGYSLRKAPAVTATVAAMRLAATALAVTIILGLILGSALGWGLALPLMQITSLHLSWGLLGWTGLLVIGVAYQVVPMFQMTPAYPQEISRRLGKSLFVLLTLWSAVELASQGRGNWPGTVLGALIAAGFTLFAAATLVLQSKRKRRMPDATLQFWRIAMASLIACAALWAVAQISPGIATNPVYGLLLGTLMVAGFAVSAINGMLYKIVPFLVWFHLQSQAVGRAVVPNVKEILPDRIAKRQLWVHMAALPLLLASALRPGLFAYPAGLAFWISFGWLWFNLLHAVRVYRKVLAGLATSRRASAC